MTFLIVSFCILIILMAYMISENKLFSPLKFFCILWSIILISSCFHLGMLKEPSYEAYFLIVIMMTMFLLGCIICKLLVNKRKVKQKSNNINLREKVFYVLCILLIICNVIDICIVIKYRLQDVPMWQIRNWALAPFGSVNPILSRRTFPEVLFRNIVLEPLGIIIHPVTAYYFFASKDKKKKTFMLLLSIIILLTASIAGGGGRLGFVYFILSYLLALISLYRMKQIDNKSIKKYKKVLISFILIAFILTIILTIVRVGKGSFLRQVYKYFAMPPTLLSEWLPRIKREVHTFGLLTTFGIHSYFFRTLNQIGLSRFVPGIFTASFSHILKAEKFLPIGSVGIGNAFVTPIYYFYIDGGYIFVIIASMVFGFIVEYAFNKIERDFNIRGFILYMIIMYGIMVSFMRIQTAIPSYIIAILFAFFLTKKKAGELS